MATLLLPRPSFALISGRGTVGAKLHVPGPCSIDSSHSPRFHAYREIACTWPCSIDFSYSLLFPKYPQYALTATISCCRRGYVSLALQLCNVFDERGHDGKNLTFLGLDGMHLPLSFATNFTCHYAAKGSTRGCPNNLAPTACKQH